MFLDQEPRVRRFRAPPGWTMNVNRMFYHLGARHRTLAGGNHTIVFAHDKERSAAFLAEMLGLPVPIPFGPFLTVQLDNEVTLDFADADGEIAGQHYAFLIGEAEFDEVFARIRARDLPYWADPYRHRPGRINTGDGGRRIYFDDPSGHFLEILTRPYGSGG